MDGEAKGDGGQVHLTQEELTILTLAQLKTALQSEQQANDELQEAVAVYGQRAADLEAELEIESLRLQLTVQASCNPASPSFLVRALTELLPQHLADGLQLTCCIRAGESWTVIAAHKNDQHKTVRTAALDEAGRVVRPQAPASLLSLVPQETAKRMVYARDLPARMAATDATGEEKRSDDLNGGAEEDAGLDALLESSVIMSAFSRCLWLITPQARLAGRTVGDMASEAATHLSQMQPVLETASQLAMAALLQQMEAQQTALEALVGRGAAALSLHLFGYRPPSQIVVSDVWAQAPSVLDELVPNACTELFLVAPPSDTGLLAVSSTCSPVLVPPSTHEASLLAACCSSGQAQVGGVGLPGTSLRLDCGGDSGVQTAVVLPLWTCAADDALTPGYRCLAVVRLRGQRLGAAAIEPITALWQAAAPLLRAWLQGPQVLPQLLNPLVAMGSPLYAPGASPPPLPAPTSEPLASLSVYLKTFLEEGASDGASPASPPELAVPVAPLADYLGLDWLLALVGGEGGSTLTLHTTEGARPFKLEDATGRLRDLIDALRQPREDALPPSSDNHDGLVHFRAEPEVALQASGLVTLLGAKAVHARLHKLLPHVPAGQCPCFGARLEQRHPQRGARSNFSIILIGGTVWRPRSVTASDLLPKLRGLGRIIQLGAEVKETGLLYSRVYSVTDKLQAELSALQVSCATAAQREMLETEQLQRLRARVAEIEESGGGVDADGEAVSGGGDDSVRVRRALIAALQGFASRAYHHGEADAAASSDAPVRHVVCQLALSETVTEEGETRRWLLQPSGEWSVLAPGAGSAIPSLSLSAAKDQEGAAAHLMTIRGAHRVVQLYSEGCADADGTDPAAAGGSGRGRVAVPSSLEASLSVYAVIGWAVIDPTTNTPVPAPEPGHAPSQPPLPPAVAIEAAWVALLSATFSKNRTRLLGGAILGTVDGWDAGEASVRAVRAGALAGAKVPLQAYLGNRAFLEGLHSRTPGYALIPIRIQGRVEGGEEGVWDVTALPPLTPSTQNTPLPAQEQQPRRLPARLGDTILRAAASRLPVLAGASADSASLPEPLPPSDVLVVAGGGGTGSSLLALSGMGGCILSHLVGSDSGVGLTLGLDSEEQQGALRSLGLTRRSLVLLYLAPPSAVFQDEREREDAADAKHLAGFLCVLRGHRLVAPCSFPQLLRLLDGATLPLRLARAIEPLFLGSGDGARMLLACWPDSTAQPGAAAAAAGSGSLDPVSLRSGEEEWARGLPERLSAAWLACSRRDVVRGIVPRGRCVRAASYVLSGLLPTPLSAAGAFASEPSEGSAAAAASTSASTQLPEWRLVLTSSSEAEGGSAPQSRSGLMEQESLLAACPVPVPGTGLLQASSATSGGADGDIFLSSGTASSAAAAAAANAGSSSGACAGLEVGWEDRALPPSTLASAAGSTRGPARLLRMFVTIPRAWLRGLPLAASMGTSAASGGKVVIASLLFWLEGLAAPVPAGVRMSLLRVASQAGGLLGSLLLEAAQKVLTATALGVRVTSLRQRSRTQAHSLAMVRGVVLSGARVARAYCDADEQSGGGGGGGGGGGNTSAISIGPSLDSLVQALTESDELLAASQARLRRALAMQQATAVGAAETGGSGEDEVAALTAALNEDSLVEHEHRWLQLTVEAAGEASSLMAMTVDQLKAERAESAALRRLLAASRVSAQLTAQSMRAFSLELGRVLPAADALLQLEADLSAAEDSEQPRGGDGEEGDNDESAVADGVRVSLRYTDCVCEVAALTTRALSQLLELCCRLGLREEASQALAAAVSPVVHPALLQPGSLVDQPRAVNWDARGVVVVWTDDAPPPAEPPALPELLSHDLLRTAWRRGLAVAGPVAGLAALPEGHPHASLCGGGQFLVEYVPFPRAAAGDTLVESGDTAAEGARADSYPQFVVQYLVPAAEANTSALRLGGSGDDEESGSADWGLKMGLSRAWLEDMLSDLQPPVRPQPNRLLLAAPGASFDASSALLSLLFAAGELLSLPPASVSASVSASAPASAGWTAFGHSAALYLSSLLRADACLLQPDVGAGGSAGEAAGGSVPQMWGTVCRFSGGVSRSDPGPVVLTAGQVELLLRRADCFDAAQRTFGGAAAAAGAAAASVVGGPVLIEGVFGGPGAGGRCVLALPVAAECGTARVCWLAVVQASRRLGQTDCDALLGAGRLLSSLAASRLHTAESAGLAGALRRAEWLRDVFGHALDVSRAVGGSAASSSSGAAAVAEAQAAVAAEETRVARVVGVLLPSLPLLQASSAVLVPVPRLAVQQALQWSRGGDELAAGPPTGEARCLAVWALVVSDGAVHVPVSVFDADEEAALRVGSGAGAEGDGGHDCWALRLAFTSNSPCLQALAELSAPPSEGASGEAHDAHAAERRAHGTVLAQTLQGLAHDVRRSLLLPRLTARLATARALTQRSALLAGEAAAGAGALARVMGAVLAHGGGSALPALGAALALCLSPGGQARDTKRGVVLSARLHWQEQPETVASSAHSSSLPSQPSSPASSQPPQPQSQSYQGLGRWLSSDPLLEGSEDGTPAQAHVSVLASGDVEDAVLRLLRLGHWAVRESSAPASVRDRAQPASPQPGQLPRAVLVSLPDADSTAASAAAGPRVWLDVSACAQLALLELRLCANALGEGASDDAAPLIALQHGVAQAVGSVASGCQLRANTLLAERALHFSRQQASVLASCLGELCTEGRAPEGYSGPSCGYIGVMLQRIQTELGRLPGVRGSRLVCRDTLEGVELYGAFGAAPGQPPLFAPSAGAGAVVSPMSASASASAGYGRPVSVTVGSSGSPSAAWPSSGSSGSSSPAAGARSAFTFGSDGAGESDQGSEYAFSCGEISGALTLYFLRGSEGSGGGGEEAAADEGRLMIGPHAAEHRQASGAVLVALGRALARRVFELHRGHRNQQLMLRQQKSVVGIKAELAARHELALELESAKSVALTQLQQAQEDVEVLRAQLRHEKGALAEAVAAHKQLAKQMQRVTTDLKTESDRELSETKAEAHRSETIAQAELARRDAIITVLRDERKAAEKTKRELAVALEREKSLDKARYELAMSCSELEAQAVKQRAELGELHGALADCKRQLATLEAERRGTQELVSLYQTEKARAETLQNFVDMLNK